MAQLKLCEILTRAGEFLQCADYAVQNNLFNACAISSYAALFWAARAALAYEGLDRQSWGHGELRAKFTEEFIKNRGRYPRRFGSWLVNAFVSRNSAQYQWDPPKVKKVRRMAGHVREFIQKVKEEIAE